MTAGLAPLTIAIAGGSDVGSVREHNEDYLLVGDLDRGAVLDVSTISVNLAADRGPLLVVCDGMGGVAGGEVAAELAARAMWREMSAAPTTPDPEVFARLLRRATRIANQDVHQMAAREPGLRGMGTTVSAAGIAGDRLVVATIGDSRAYILRGRALVQVTRDQSLSQALIAAGHPAFEAAIAGGAILQALGVGDDVEPSLSIIELRRGDRVLLCSDGLHGLVGDSTLVVLLATSYGLDESTRLLIAAARAAGGGDNITAVLADVGGERLAPPTSDDDLPAYQEFDPQREGAHALTTTSQVAHRLAQRIGLGSAPTPPKIPVTGQHRVLEPQVRRRRVPNTELPSTAGDSPARDKLAGWSRVQWWWYALAVVVVVVAAAIGVAILR